MELTFFYPNILAKLKKAYLKGNLPHYLLFLGPKWTGKEELALEIAKFLNCKNKEGCQSCDWCKRVEVKKPVEDLILVKKESQNSTFSLKEEITLKDIQPLQRALTLTPNYRFKIGIILRGDKLNQEAQNALLKTLEEPKGRKVIIMTGEIPSKILPTLQSRAIIFYLHPQPLKKIKAYLKNNFPQLQTSEIEEIAKISFGLPKLALKLAQEKETLQSYKKIFQLAENLIEGDTYVKLKIAQKLAQSSPPKIEKVFGVLQLYLGTKLKEAIFKGDFTQGLKIAESLEKINQFKSLAFNLRVNPQLCFENMALSL